MFPLTHFSPPGRKHLPTPGAVAHRFVPMKYVSVAKAAGQWLVSVENEVPQSFATRGEAVVAALQVARRVHADERQPSAVRALLSSGEWSVLSRFDAATG
jgi:hypothetical protein